MSEEFVGSKKKLRSMKRTQTITNVFVYALLIVICVIWITPILWLFANSFKGEGGSRSEHFFPQEWTFANYGRLFVDTGDLETSFFRWFGNTLFVAIFSCVITTLFVLAVAYVMSRFRFKMRKPLMNLCLILGMFPGFMSMIAIYYIFDAIGLTGTLWALIIAYSFGAGTGFYISKGFFDTVPRALDEAAKIDGATRAQIFFLITLPLSKPIIVYTVLTAFMSPWMDFIFASFIMKENTEMYTVAVGLQRMTHFKYIGEYFGTFCAGAVVISIPITALFILMQKYYVGGITGGAVKG